MDLGELQYPLFNGNSAYIPPIEERISASMIELVLIGDFILQMGILEEAQARPFRHPPILFPISTLKVEMMLFQA